MKTLVTGATGLLGNNVVRMLVEKGRDVRVLTRKSSDSRPLADLPVEIWEGDIREEDSVHEAVAGMDVVIHCAGYVHVGWSGLELARAINVTGTELIAQASLSANARMIHVSSVDALGVGSPDMPADEQSPREGKTPCTYVVTKREAEEVV